MKIDQASLQTIDYIPNTVQNLIDIHSKNKYKPQIALEEYSSQQNNIYSFPSYTGKRKKSVILFFHGGGYFLPLSKTTYIACSSLSKNISEFADVLLVTFPLSSECKFPDNLRITHSHLLSIKERLQSKYQHIFFCGESSGANMCAVIASEYSFKIKGIILITPSLDYYKQDYPSKKYSTKQKQPALKIRQFLADLYVPQNIEKSSPLLSPIYSENLSSFPPALIFIAGNDPFRDEAALFHDKLHDLGVISKIIGYEETIHNFFSYRIDPHFSNCINTIKQFIHSHI